ncbi:MAG: cytochrome c biogenesis protein [Candidatus Omnitrophota bacterium]
MLPFLENPYLFLHIITIHLSYIIFFLASAAALIYLVEDTQLKHKKTKVLFSRLPDLSFLDKLNYRLIGLGFPILTLSIISGVFWVRDIQGAYWSWNPREVYSLVLWLLYAATLHVRLSEKLRGRKVAILSLAAFAIIVLSLFSNCP